MGGHGSRIALQRLAASFAARFRRLTRIAGVIFPVRPFVAIDALGQILQGALIVSRRNSHRLSLHLARGRVAFLDPSLPLVPMEQVRSRS